MVAVRVCGAAERAEVIALLDEEFIVSRGRSVSLGARFSAVFNEPDAKLLAAREGERIVAALLVRPFAWLAAQGTFRGAMIGMVCARREHRGKGLGSALMNEASRLLRAQTDFAVLWTTQPEFYRRLGWLQADCGIMGRMRGEGGSVPMAPAQVDALLARIHRAREAQGGERLERSLAGYRTLPPPAVIREALLEAGSYAVIGRDGDTAYVYEVGGDVAGLAALHDALRERYRDITLNLMRGGAAHLWFAARPDISWTEQSLAMWLPISGAVDMARLARCYIPFLDRI